MKVRKNLNSLGMGMLVLTFLILTVMWSNSRNVYATEMTSANETSMLVKSLKMQDYMKLIK